MAATVAQSPAPVPRVVHDPNSISITAATDAAAAATTAAGGAEHTADGQSSEDAGPKVPPQHQRVKLSDFALVRTLGTGRSLVIFVFL